MQWGSCGAFLRQDINKSCSLACDPAEGSGNVLALRPHCWCCWPAKLHVVTLPVTPAVIWY